MRTCSVDVPVIGWCILLSASVVSQGVIILPTSTCLITELRPVSPEGFSTQDMASPPTGPSYKVRDFNRFGIDPAASRSCRISKFVVPDRKQSWNEGGAVAVRELAPRTSILQCALPRLREPAYARIQLGGSKYYGISMPLNVVFIFLCPSVLLS